MTNMNTLTINNIGDASVRDALRSQISSADSFRFLSTIQQDSIMRRYDDLVHNMRRQREEVLMLDINEAVVRAINELVDDLYDAFYSYVHDVVTTGHSRYADDDVDLDNTFAEALYKYLSAGEEAAVGYDKFESESELGFIIEDMGLDGCNQILQLFDSLRMLTRLFGVWGDKDAFKPHVMNPIYMFVMGEVERALRFENLAYEEVA